MISSIYKKYKYDKTADRLGPDLPFTHWNLFFPKRMNKICKRKFKFFADTAHFRPHSYAITCSKISIGNRVVIRPGTMLFADPREGSNGTIVIEDDVLIGSGVHVYVSNHSYKNSDMPIIDQGHDSPKNVTISKGSWIGANATILPGITIGENAVVGAGSVVTKDVKPGSIVAGIPAKEIKKTNDDYSNQISNRSA